MPNRPPELQHVVVIGASAGGLDAIAAVIRGLPPQLPMALFIVQHIPAYAPSNLDRVLANYTKLRVQQAEDGEPIRAGMVYVPQADRHLLVESGVVRVTKGPRENRFRPAVDTLFRSAAYAYRERVIGIVLSGALNDGTSGMWSIKRFGGTAIVQKSEEAMFDDMPLGVMEYTEVDHVLPAARIGGLLSKLGRESTGKPKTPVVEKQPSDKLLEIELAIARGDNGFRQGILEMGEPSNIACPECHGVLSKFREGKIIRYRCHTGHAHTAVSLLASVQDKVEKSMWEVMRGMEESQILLNNMAENLEGTDAALARRYRREAEAIQEQAGLVQQAIRRVDRAAMGVDSVPQVDELYAGG